VIAGPLPDFTPPSTRLKFWGVRGSIPVPGSSTVGYGGNTSCIEVRAEGEIIILDAGSGIRELGIALEAEFGTRPIKLTLLLSHTHWDHIQGLPFFLPAYNGNNSMRVLGYRGADEGLRAILTSQMAPSVFPLPLHALPSTISIEEQKELAFSIGKVRVQAHYVRHPGICVGYRLYTSNGSIAYLPDNEPYPAHAAAERAKLVEFLHGVDVLIIDSQYTDDEYQEKIGWGHGSLSSVVSLALDAGVRKLFLFHHEPRRDDRALDAIVESARMIVLESGQPMEVDAAREGSEVWLGAKVAKTP
jgi:phosphoribosyl 1,2-cyclic phosphodiesterase